MSPLGSDHIPTKLGMPIKFCHIDAAHDYDSVRETIELLLPRLVPGGSLVRTRLSVCAMRGGATCVEEWSGRCATLPGRVSRGNNWYYVNMQYQ